MVSTILSQATASVAVIGVAITGCVVFWVIATLTDDQKKPVIALIANRITIFAVPLLVLFTYLTIMWATAILSD